MFGVHTRNRHTAGTGRSVAIHELLLNPRAHHTMNQPGKGDPGLRRDMARSHLRAEHRLSGPSGSVCGMSTDAPVSSRLLQRRVGELSGNFLVPDYQRGYRWGESEINHLLEDVKDSVGYDYYLQPLVVKRIDEGQWELVDGQQRLTTLYLIFQFIEVNHLPRARAPYTLEYATRPDSANYLRTLDPATAQENIDFFHIFSAYQIITRWFDAQLDGLQAAIDFYTAASKNLYVIWYEAEHDVDAKELFRRLNVGRIPLTDAELVKALLLARVRVNFPDGGRAHEVAAQWDVIERSLRRPEVWAFISGQDKREATHIRLLLDALADRIARPPRGRRPSFHTFETLRPLLEADADNVWNTIQDLYSLLIGWYENRTSFHLVGYLVAIDESFTSISDMAEGLTHTAFQAALVERIRTRLKLTADGVRELTYPSPRCTQVLLLMNVEATHPDQRYSFDRYAAAGWSLEHIHAQNAEALTQAEQWRAWLKDHLAVIKNLELLDPMESSILTGEVHDALSAKNLTATTFRALEARVASLFASNDLAEEIHSITNLALLGTRDNSALNNSVFAVKREMILDLDRQGAYIPPCTRNVFLKYYTPLGGQQLHLWGPSDRKYYLEELLRLVGPYLLDSKDSE